MKTLMKLPRNQNKEESPRLYSCNSFDIAIWLRDIVDGSGRY